MGENKVNADVHADSLETLALSLPGLSCRYIFQVCRDNFHPDGMTGNVITSARLVRSSSPTGVAFPWLSV